MSIFVTSDHHFFHKNIIKYSNRPFDFSTDGVVQMCKTLMENYNGMVNHDDIVIFLGDVAFLKKDNQDLFREFFQCFKGKKFLIKGNHDKLSNEYYKSCGFIDVFDYLVVGRYFLTHYPLVNNTRIEQEQREIFRKSKCDTIIHGHIHTLPSPHEDNISRMNVCVDYAPNMYYPVKLHGNCTKTFLKHFDRYFQ